MIPGISPNPVRFDTFEPGDKTALVCMDVPEMERIAIEQLVELGHKVHTGHSIEDLLFKLQAHLYDVLIIAENFGASTLETNPLLNQILREPAAQRHKHLVVLIGASVRTADENQAFQNSVDLVVNLADVRNLRPVIRRALMRTQEFYSRFLEAITAADVV
jgi:CheY-like chemotaxis protein